MIPNNTKRTLVYVFFYLTPNNSNLASLKGHWHAYWQEEWLTLWLWFVIHRKSRSVLTLLRFCSVSTMFFSTLSAFFCNLSIRVAKSVSVGLRWNKGFYWVSQIYTFKSAFFPKILLYVVGLLCSISGSRTEHLASLRGHALKIKTGLETLSFHIIWHRFQIC